jgi:hypothetical protein
MKSVNRNLTAVVFLALVSLIFISSVNAESLKLFVNDIEFNSNLIKIGEEANLKINIKNLSKDKENCKVTIFCGGKELKQQEISVEPESSFSLQHEFNTSHMSTGTYSIETLIQSQDQDQIFGLGKIELVTDSVLPNSFSVDSFESPIFLILTPVATVLSVVFLMKKWKKQSEESDEELNIEAIPKLLGGVFSTQKNNESITSENDINQCKQDYIC